MLAHVPVYLYLGFGGTFCFISSSHLLSKKHAGLELELVCVLQGLLLAARNLHQATCTSLPPASRMDMGPWLAREQRMGEGACD